jgi:hypothetical protein
VTSGEFVLAGLLDEDHRAMLAVLELGDAEVCVVIGCRPIDVRTDLREEAHPN